MGQRGKKICPSCDKAQGVRTYACECGFQFKPGKAMPKKELKGIGKGKKQCPACSKLVGPRTLSCACGHEFKTLSSSKPNKIKKVKFKKTIDNWRELQSGDRIRCIKGYGPHYIDEVGDKVFFRERGVLVVQRKDRNGLICHGPEGSGYIYMGPVKTSSVIPNGVKEPHKLVRIR